MKSHNQLINLAKRAIKIHSRFSCQIPNGKTIWFFSLNEFFDVFTHECSFYFLFSVECVGWRCRKWVVFVFLFGWEKGGCDVRRIFRICSIFVPEKFHSSQSAKKQAKFSLFVEIPIMHVSHYFLMFTLFRRHLFGRISWNSKILWLKFTSFISVTDGRFSFWKIFLDFSFFVKYLIIN